MKWPIQRFPTSKWQNQSFKSRFRPSHWTVALSTFSTLPKNQQIPHPEILHNTFSSIHVVLDFSSVKWGHWRQWPQRFLCFVKDVRVSKAQLPKSDWWKSKKWKCPVIFPCPLKLSMSESVLSGPRAGFYLTTFPRTDNMKERGAHTLFNMRTNLNYYCLFQVINFNISSLGRLLALLLFSQVGTTWASLQCAQGALVVFLSMRWWLRNTDLCWAALSSLTPNCYQSVCMRKS